MSAVNLVEVSIVFDNRAPRVSPDRLDALIAELGIEIVPFDRNMALLARDAHRTFGKNNHKARLNFGDCCVYALAKATGRPLLFKGNDFTLTDITPALPDAGAPDRAVQRGIPARMQAGAASTLARLVTEALAALTPSNTQTFHGPRRIALAATVAGNVPAASTVERGPRTSAPPQAIEGFLRKHGATREQLTEEGGHWLLTKSPPPHPPPC